MAPRTKDEWRRLVLEGRRTAGPNERADEDRALVRHVSDAVLQGSTVCAYAPTSLEPGTTDLLDAIGRIAGRVLLPVTGEPGPLAWAEYTGTENLVAASHGLREPSGPKFEPSEVARAETILVPALAVDRRGVRLGRGAGYYDRTLHLAAPDARLVTIVRDSELVEQLPEDPHDVRMGWVLTPGLGLRELTPETNRAE